MDELGLDLNERVVFALRSLYAARGYSQYKMSKFEEYDLYARNKDFLISDSVITFTDTSGKLMALKPDVTLSIIKNVRDEPTHVRKLCYNENVYRAAKGARAFREIMQVGLECLGLIDDYCICEVIELAARSLGSISERYVLDVSHLGLLTSAVDALGVPEGGRAEILKCVGEKNVHELAKLCRGFGAPEEAYERLKALVAASGRPGEVLPVLEGLFRGPAEEAALRQLRGAAGATDGGEVRIDFSVVSDTSYYNGVVFKGFIEGVPSAVLSGGQYDKLMRKMGRESGAIGFAVYLDLIERLGEECGEYDVDTLLLYDGGAPAPEVKKAVDSLASGGGSVMAQREDPGGIKYRRLARLSGGEVEILENDA